MEDREKDLNNEEEQEENEEVPETEETETTGTEDDLVLEEETIEEAVSEISTEDLLDVEEPEETETPSEVIIEEETTETIDESTDETEEGPLNELLNVSTEDGSLNKISEDSEEEPETSETEEDVEETTETGEAEAEETKEEETAPENVEETVVEEPEESIDKTTDVELPETPSEDTEETIQEEADDLKKQIDEKLRDIEEQSNLLMEYLAEKMADSRDTAASVYDNVKHDLENGAEDMRIRTGTLDDGMRQKANELLDETKSLEEEAVNKESESAEEETSAETEAPVEEGTEEETTAETPETTEETTGETEESEQTEETTEKILQEETPNEETVDNKEELPEETETETPKEEEPSVEEATKETETTTVETPEEPEPVTELETTPEPEPVPSEPETEKPTETTKPVVTEFVIPEPEETEPTVEKPTQKEPEEKKGFFSSKSNIVAFFAVIGMLAAMGLCVFLAMPTLQKNSQYRSAIKQMERGEYEEAYASLDGLAGYKDADQYISYCRALEHYTNGELDEAIADFSSVGDLGQAQQYVSYITAEKTIKGSNKVQDYNDAIELFKQASNLLDSKGMIEYCQGIIAFLNNEDKALDQLQKIADKKEIKEKYYNEAANLIRYVAARDSFDSDDMTSLNVLRNLVDDRDSLVASLAGAYVDYIDGLDYFEKEKYYSAFVCFSNASEIRDGAERAEACFQERPASGILYRNSASDAVDITIYDSIDNKDMFVKIYDDSDELVETLYIRDGAAVTAYFQSGTYRIAVAIGSSDWWFGTEEAFGEDAIYQKLLLNGSEEYYEFPSGNSYSLSFDVENGNANRVCSSFKDF